MKGDRLGDGRRHERRQEGDKQGDRRRRKETDREIAGE